jgi:hypothetical protein
VFHYGAADRRPLDAVPAVTSRFSAFHIFIFAAAGCLPCSLAAQSSGKDEVIKPPPGMCRIWVDGVRADKQPAPTDCASALKNKPTNGRVIFGDAKPAVIPSPPSPGKSKGKKSPPDSSKKKTRPRGRGDTLSRRAG